MPHFLIQKALKYYKSGQEQSDIRDLREYLCISVQKDLTPRVEKGIISTSRICFRLSQKPHNPQLSIAIKDLNNLTPYYTTLISLK